MGPARDRPCGTERIALTGLMGSGKSSVGLAVAATLGLPYLDNDAEIAVLAGATTVDLARRPGDELHTWESAYALDLARREGPWVAGLPGSCGDRPQELAKVRAAAVVVYLRCSAPTLVRRVAADGERPWLGDGATAAFIATTLARRDCTFLAAATAVVDADEPLERVVKAVLLAVAR